MISWSVPTNPNGHLVGYTVYWAEKKNVARAYSRYVEAPQTHLTLSELSSSYYQVKTLHTLVKYSRIEMLHSFFLGLGVCLDEYRQRAKESDLRGENQLS